VGWLTTNGEWLVVGGISAAGECSLYLLDPTLATAIVLKRELHDVADLEGERLRLRLHRACANRISREGSEGE